MSTDPRRLAKETVPSEAAQVRCSDDRARRLKDYVEGLLPPHLASKVDVVITPAVQTAAVLPATEDALLDAERTNIDAAQARALIEHISGEYLILVTANPAPMGEIPFPDQMTADRVQQYGLSFHETLHILKTAVGAVGDLVADEIEEEYHDLVHSLINTVEDAAIESEAIKGRNFSDGVEMWLACVRRMFASPLGDVNSEGVVVSFWDAVTSALYYYSMEQVYEERDVDSDGMGVIEGNTVTALRDESDSRLEFRTEADRKAFLAVDDALETLAQDALQIRSATRDDTTHTHDKTASVRRAKRVIETWHETLKPVIDQTARDHHQNQPQPGQPQQGQQREADQSQTQAQSSNDASSAGNAQPQSGAGTVPETESDEGDDPSPATQSGTGDTQDEQTACPECDEEFDSEHGLRTHYGQLHGDTAPLDQQETKHEPEDAGGDSETAPDGHTDDSDAGRHADDQQAPIDSDAGDSPDTGTGTTQEAEESSSDTEAPGQEAGQEQEQEQGRGQEQDGPAPSINELDVDPDEISTSRVATEEPLQDLSNRPSISPDEPGPHEVDLDPSPDTSGATGDSGSETDSSATDTEAPDVEYPQSESGSDAQPSDTKPESDTQTGPKSDHTQTEEGTKSDSPRDETSEGESDRDAGDADEESPDEAAGGGAPPDSDTDQPTGGEADNDSPAPSTLADHAAGNSSDTGVDEPGQTTFDDFTGAGSTTGSTPPSPPTSGQQDESPSDAEPDESPPSEGDSSNPSDTPGEGIDESTSGQMDVETDAQGKADTPHDSTNPDANEQPDDAAGDAANGEDSPATTTEGDGVDDGESGYARGSDGNDGSDGEDGKTADTGTTNSSEGEEEDRAATPDNTPSETNDDGSPYDEDKRGRLDLDQLETDRDRAQDTARRTAIDQDALAEELEALDDRLPDSDPTESSADENQQEAGGDQAGPGSLGELTILPHADERVAPREWEQVEKAADTVADTLAKQLALDRQSDTRRGLTSGDFDPTAGHRLAVGDTRTFESEMPGDDKEYALVIVLDRSGSMGWSDPPKIRTATAAVARFALAAERLGIEVAVIDFYDEEARLIKPFSVEVEHAQAAILTQETAGGTPLSDGIALGRALVERRDYEPLLVTITDDIPEDVDAVASEIQQTRAPVCSLTIATDCAKGDAPSKAQRLESKYDRTATVFSPGALDRKLDQFASLLVGF